MDENIDNVVAKGSKTELRKDALGGELIKISLSFDLLLIFLFLLSLFQAVRPMGFLKCLVMNFAYPRLSVKIGGITERHSSAAFSEGV